MRALVLSLLLVIPAAPALAQAPAPTVHPIYAETPGSGRNQQAHRQFSEAAARYRLGPVEVIDIPGPPAPRAPALLESARPLTEKLKFAEAEAALDAAVAEVIATGGQGMSPAALSDLFLFQAIAAQKANWNELEAPLTEIAPPKAREAYLRAAVLAPDRVLERRRYPPLAIASFALAAAEVKGRPRGSIVVRGASTAEVSIDGAPDRLAPATSADLPYGDHFVRVEVVGHQPFAAVVPLAMSSLEIDAPPTAPLTLDDARAAAHARRMGASFALVAALKLGPRTELGLRLVEASTGAARDATAVPLGGEAGALDAAVMRLDEEARRLALGKQEGAIALPASDLTLAPVPSGPAPTGPPLTDDPRGWARRNWPLLTAIGATVATALALGLAVANDSRAPR
jgi:hypothetical protein